MKLKVKDITVDLIDEGDRVCAHIARDGAFEPESLKAWYDMVEPGTEVLDVGAYNGLFAIIAAKLGARPTAIEPMPFMQERIVQNAEANGVKINLIKGAASDKSGPGSITFNAAVPWTAGASMERKSGAKLLIRLLRLDDMKFNDRVSAMKIDVERHEVAVLRGAVRLIKRHQPVILVEVLEQETLHTLATNLAAWGYKSDWHRLDVRNVVFRHES